MKRMPAAIRELNAPLLRRVRAARIKKCKENGEREDGDLHEVIQVNIVIIIEQ